MVKLEVGKQYVTRGGDVVSITKKNSSSNEYPFEGDNIRHYTEDGVWILNKVSQVDLIKEHIPKSFSDMKHPGNYKIRIPNEEICKRVQQVLFNLGYNWGSITEKSVLELGKSYLYIYESSYIGWHVCDKYFQNHENTEVSYEEVLADEKFLVDEATLYDLTEVKEMELKNMKKENIAEALKQVTEERNNAEVEAAKKQLRHAQDQIDYLDRVIADANADKKPHLEVIKQFTMVTSPKKRRK